MASISLRGVSAKYELLTVLDYNLKHRLVQMARRRRLVPEVITALREIDLDLHAGDRVGLIGANGAGKSTLLAVMAGLLPPTAGTVKIEGRVLALLGGAGAGLAQEASGLDNIVGMGVQLGETPAEMRGRIEDIVEFSGLAARIHHPIYSYSTGMQARLRFSILTSLKPDVLLLDEGLSTADADFESRAQLRLSEMLAGTGLVVLATHDRTGMSRLCERAYWLRDGLLVTAGRVDDVWTAYQNEPTRV